MIKQKFNIQGMHCASCANIIKQTVKNIPGVDNVEINFATEKANIKYDQTKTNLESLNLAVKNLGYSLVPEENDNINKTTSPDYQNEELKKQKKKLYFVLPLSIIIFLLMLFDIAGKFFTNLPEMPMTMESLNTILLLLGTIVMFWIGQPFLQGIIRFIKYRTANMDTLIGIGTLTAYLYSAFVTLFPQIRASLDLPEYTYFDVVIVVIGFVVLGKYLEARSKQKTGEAIKHLLGLQAKTAIVIRDGQEKEIPIEGVVVGDIIIVKPGMKIPVDGKITEGKTTIDESMITGESMPVDKNINDTVVGATINKQGNIKIKATKIGSDTVLSQIIRLVEDAQGSKAPIQNMVDKISAIFVPTVLVISLITIISWFTVGTYFLGFNTAFSFGILSFVSILVIACPCALGLATPTAIVVGVGRGAENGILIKNAEGLEMLNKVNTIVFDKTGTITNGKPVVTDFILIDPLFKEGEITQMVGSVEKMSEHPLAQALYNYLLEKKLSILKVENFSVLEGVGVTATIAEKKIYIHKPEKNYDPNITKLQQQGKTVIIADIDNVPSAIIALSDTIKKDAKETIQKLKESGIEVVLLTGDNHLAARYIAEQAGIEKIISEVLPAEKSKKIKDLQDEGKVVAMCGDGINDAPALAQADVGIAMSTGTDAAIESASITLLHGDIKKVSRAITLSQLTMKTIRQNLFWAFIYNIIGIPIAAGLLYPIWGITLNPIFAGLAMAGSSVSVVSNSLKLKIKKISS